MEPALRRADPPSTDRLMLEPEVIIVPAVFLFPTVAVVIRMLLRHKEKMASLGQLPPLEIETRLARVEQAVEAIAIEVERVGEGQRFLTKVLTDRLPSLAEGAASHEKTASAPR